MTPTPGSLHDDTQEQPLHHEGTEIIPVEQIHAMIGQTAHEVDDSPRRTFTIPGNIQAQDIRFLIYEFACTVFKSIFWACRASQHSCEAGCKGDKQLGEWLPGITHEAVRYDAKRMWIICVAVSILDINTT